MGRKSFHSPNSRSCTSYGESYEKYLLLNPFQTNAIFLNPLKTETHRFSSLFIIWHDCQQTFTFSSKSTTETLKKWCEICLKLTIKTPEQGQWHGPGVFIVNFEYISHLFSCFSCWLIIGNFCWVAAWVLHFLCPQPSVLSLQPSTLSSQPLALGPWP